MIIIKDRTTNTPKYAFNDQIQEDLKLATNIENISRVGSSSDFCYHTNLPSYDDNILKSFVLYSDHVKAVTIFTFFSFTLLLIIH